MGLPGSRTKTTDTWLLPQDEALLGRQIQQALPGPGWLCSQLGPPALHEKHLHPLVEEALACGGTQAFLPLPAGAVLPDVSMASPENTLVVQLLRSRRLAEADGEVFRSGRLAVRWFEPEEGLQMHQLLNEQTRRIWQALRAATRPAILEDATGRKINGTRIGDAARELVERTGMRLTLGGVQRLSLSTKPSRNRA